MGSLRVNQCFRRLPTDSLRVNQCFNGLHMGSLGVNQCFRRLPMGSLRVNQCSSGLPLLLRVHHILMIVITVIAAGLGYATSTMIRRWWEINPQWIPLALARRCWWCLIVTIMKDITRRIPVIISGHSRRNTSSISAIGWGV